MIDTLIAKSNNHYTNLICIYYDPYILLNYQVFYDTDKFGVPKKVDINSLPVIDRNDNGVCTRGSQSKFPKSKIYFEFLLYVKRCCWQAGAGFDFPPTFQVIIIIITIIT